MNAVSLTWVRGKGEHWGPLLGFFKAALPQHPGAWCSLGFAWLVWGFFVSPGRNLFGFFLCFFWAWRGCSSNPSAAFRGELDSLVLIQDQWEQVPGEEIGWARPEGGAAPFWPQTGEKARARQGKHTCFTRGPTTEIHQVPICLRQLLREPFGFFSETGAGVIFLPTRLLAVVGFYLALAFCCFVFFFPGQEGVCVKVWQFNI